MLFLLLKWLQKYSCMGKLFCQCSRVFCISPCVFWTRKFPINLLFFLLFSHLNSWCHTSSPWNWLEISHLLVNISVGTPQTSLTFFPICFSQYWFYSGSTRSTPHRLAANTVAQASVASLSPCDNVLISLTVIACQCNKDEEVRSLLKNNEIFSGCPAENNC